MLTYTVYNHCKGQSAECDHWSQSANARYDLLYTNSVKMRNATTGRRVQELGMTHCAQIPAMPAERTRCTRVRGQGGFPAGMASDNLSVAFVQVMINWAPNVTSGRSGAKRASTDSHAFAYHCKERPYCKE